MDDDWGDYVPNLRTPPDYTTVDLSLPTYEEAVREGAGGTMTIIDVSKPESDDEILATSTQIDDVSWRNRLYTSEPVTQNDRERDQVPIVTTDIRQNQKDIKCCMIVCILIILLTVGMIGSQYFDK